MPYRDLNPRTQLEQAVARDLKAALEKRGASVVHHGTAAAHAPASAPCDISVSYGSGKFTRHILVEVAQRNDASEFQSIVSHLDAWAHNKSGRVNLLYSGRSTSARMARLVRNENERRELVGLAGRIIFIKFDDLEQFLSRWAGLPATEAPIADLNGVFAGWKECVDDLSASRVFQQRVFPEWIAKAQSIDEEKCQRLSVQQEHLKKDIVKLENRLRNKGITGNRAHKYLIYLFFMALFEDKRGMNTRATRKGFLAYRETIPEAAQVNPEFNNKTVHHLLSQNILATPEIRLAGIPSQYEAIDLPDDFVLDKVIPVFEEYSFADASIDAIGAVFEALARRAEKDNRIGQFFTPENAVAATVRLAGLRATDLVSDPACGTGRFLIHAMADMLSSAHHVTGKTLIQAETSIRQHQLLGCDIDPWISVIAKMNMYIHGDGKSNIKHADGLTISTTAVFAPFIQHPVVDMLDVILMNPPLGDIDFGAVADQVARSELQRDNVPITDEAIASRSGHWSQSVFQVVPHKIKEEDERDNAIKKQEEFTEKAIVARLEGNDRLETRAKAKAKEWSEKRQVAEQAIGAGRVTHIAAGSNAKGGPLFVSSSIAALKRIRDASLPNEWRGGILGMIIDEAVLNTREYSEARAFFRKFYFIKAIVSLPRDMFADLAKTTAKTSIVLLVKKEDPDVIQREPVFYAKAVRAGPTGKDITRANELVPICDAFDRWRTAVLAACQGGAPLLEPALSQAGHAMFEGLPVGIQVAIRALDPSRQTERLDEAYWCAKDLILAMPESVPLSVVADLITEGRTPPTRDVYHFASISRNDVRVQSKGLASTLYGPSDLRVISEGDVLVSGIDLVHGAVGVVDAACDGLIVSKEYYILRTKNDMDGHYLAALLRTPAMRRIIEGTVTGTSNRTRVESADVLMALPIPPPPSIGLQRSIGSDLRKSSRLHQMMRRRIMSAEMRAAAAGGLSTMTVSTEEDGNEAE